MIYFVAKTCISSNCFVFSDTVQRKLIAFHKHKFILEYSYIIGNKFSYIRKLC